MKLALGTAQWGMEYGINNSIGIVYRKASFQDARKQRKTKFKKNDENKTATLGSNEKLSSRKKAIMKKRLLMI